MTNDLDTFEARLLGELRNTVAARSQDQTSYRLSPVQRRRRRIGAAVATVALAIGGVIVIPGVVGSQAYAVSDGPSGTVELKVNRLEDAAGLQRALIDHGVKANVQYLGERHEVHTRPLSVRRYRRPGQLHTHQCRDESDLRRAGPARRRSRRDGSDRRLADHQRHIRRGGHRRRAGSSLSAHFDVQKRAMTNLTRPGAPTTSST